MRAIPGSACFSLQARKALADLIPAYAALLPAQYLGAKYLQFIFYYSPSSHKFRKHKFGYRDLHFISAVP